jgi:hypothetical protein
MIERSAAERRDIGGQTENVSPFRGFVVAVAPNPMAYAMGYRSIAAPRLSFLRALVPSVFSLKGRETT